MEKQAKEPQKRFKDYGDYIMNKTAADIMEEYSEQRDEWVECKKAEVPSDQK